MWFGFFLCLVVGLAIGYFFTVSLYRKILSSNEQQAQLMSEKAEAVDKEVQSLQQEVADLKYLLGEEKKARAYAEQRNSRD